MDLLLAAWPLVLAERARRAPRDRRLRRVPGRPWRASPTRWAAATSPTRARSRRPGRELEGGPPGELRHLAAFLDGLEGERRDAYLAAAAGLAERVGFTGRLEHGDLPDLLPACQALVMPSTFPEAFGMVAAEAAACGALPLSAAHSGMAEVTATLAPALERGAAAAALVRASGRAPSRRSPRG